MGLKVGDKNREFRGNVRSIRLSQYLALDPRSTCCRSFPCGPPRAIFARAPGLPPTGQTYPTPRNSILPSTWLLVLLDQCFAIDPRSPSLNHLAMKRVTTLEPRTPHQPEKLKKLSKNESVVLLPLQESTKVRDVISLVFSRVQAVHSMVTRFGAAEHCSISQTAREARLSRVGTVAHMRKKSQ